MRVGIVSDIHGQPDELERVLEHMAKMNIDRVLCAGDLVDKGPDSEGVIDLIRESCIPTVLGNHDENAVRHNALHLQSSPDETPLTEDALAFLEGLPMTRDYVWEGQRLLLAHGIPTSNQRYFWPDKTPKGFKRWARHCWTDIVVLGHTHRPMRVEWNDLLILNPGSVSCIRQRDSGTFGVLTLPEGRFEVFDHKTCECVEF